MLRISFNPCSMSLRYSVIDAMKSRVVGAEHKIEVKGSVAVGVDIKHHHPSSVKIRTHHVGYFIFR